MEAFTEYIKRYIPLSESEEELIYSKLTSKTYKKGQYLVQGGVICKYQNFIISGTVRTFYIDHKGNEHIVNFGIENWWAADLGSFITQRPADFHVQCIQETNVIQLSYTASQQLYDELPKMERFFRIIIQKAYVKTQQRLVQSHSLTAQERYAQFCKDYPRIEQRVPQYMVASYLGITKEFLSTIRRQ